MDEPESEHSRRESRESKPAPRRLGEERVQEIINRRCAFAKEMGLSSTSLQRWELLFQVRAREARQAGAFQRVTIECSAATADVDLIFPSGARLVGLSWQQVR